jgi:hypothetical protein
MRWLAELRVKREQTYENNKCCEEPKNAYENHTHFARHLSPFAES